MGIAVTLPDNPIEALDEISSLKGELAGLERAEVLRAREAGISWQRIADALGMSRQAAWERFTRPAVAAIAQNVADNAGLAEAEAIAEAVDEVSSYRRERRPG